MAHTTIILLNYGLFLFNPFLCLKQIFIFMLKMKLGKSLTERLIVKMH